MFKIVPALTFRRCLVVRAQPFTPLVLRTTPKIIKVFIRNGVRTSSLVSLTRVHAPVMSGNIVPSRITVLPFCVRLTARIPVAPWLISADRKWLLKSVTVRWAC